MYFSKLVFYYETLKISKMLLGGSATISMYCGRTNGHSWRLVLSLDGLMVILGD